MKSSTKPDIWTLSPQMTAAANIWKDCKLFFNLLDDIFPVNLIGDETFDNNDTRVTLGTISAVGKANTIASGSSNLQISSNKRLPTGTGMTWAFYFIPSFGEDSTFRVLGSSAESNSNGLRALYATGGAGIWRFRNSSSGTNCDVTLSHSSGDEIIYIGRLDDDNVLKCDVFNLTAGTSASNTTASAGSVSSHENNMRVSSMNGSSDGIPGDFLWFAVWDRGLSDGDIKDLVEDPFAMLRPAGF